MRTLTLVTLIGLALSYAGVTGAGASAWCADYGQATTNCGFVTAQQCEADISGVGGFCRPNPAGN